MAGMTNLSGGLLAGASPRLASHLVSYHTPRHTYQPRRAIWLLAGLDEFASKGAAGQQSRTKVPHPTHQPPSTNNPSPPSNTLHPLIHPYLPHCLLSSYTPSTLLPLLPLPSSRPCCCSRTGRATWASQSPTVSSQLQRAAWKQTRSPSSLLGLPHPTPPQTPAYIYISRIQVTPCTPPLPLYTSTQLTGELPSRPHPTTPTNHHIIQSHISTPPPVHTPCFSYYTVHLPRHPPLLYTHYLHTPFFPDTHPLFWPQVR